MAQKMRQQMAKPQRGHYIETKPSDYIEHGIKPARIQHKPALRPAGSGQIKPPPTQQKSSGSTNG